MPLRRRSMLLALLALMLAATSLWVASELSARGRERQLERMVAGLDPGLIRHLVRDKDRAWIAYCRSIGAGPLGVAHQQIGSALRVPDYALFLERRVPVERAHLRIGVGFRGAFGFLPPVSRIARDMALEPQQEFRLRALEREYIALSTDNTLPAMERIAAAERIAQEFRAVGDTNRAIYPEALAVQWDLDRDRYGQRLRSLVATVRDLKEDYMLCQVLGQLGTVHHDSGEFDSVRACYDEGIQVAMSHGFIDHSSRLLRFYAEFYFQRGRLAAALDCMKLALRLAEEPGGEFARTRLQVDYARFLARIGSWDLVERCLRRMPPLLRALPDYRDGIERKRYGFDARLMEARLAFAMGRVEEASRMMTELLDRIPASEPRVLPAEIFDRWSLGLEMTRRPADALAVAERGIAYCDSASVPERLRPLLLRASRVNAALGRPVEGMRTLARMRREFGGSPSIPPADLIGADVVEARLLALGGKRDEARRKIEKAWASWEGDSSQVLTEDQGAELRTALTEILGLSAEQTYALEMAWRASALRQGRPSEGRSEPWRAPRPFVPPGTAHIVYRFTGDRLQRWTATSTSVVLDTLPVEAWRCLGQVRDVLEALGHDDVRKGEVMGAESRRLLRQLSADLLPRAWSSPRERPANLLVSPDGPLTSLPFAALPWSGDSAAAPIVLSANVAYLRGWQEPRRRPEGTALIVSNPKLSADFARRYQLAAELPASAEEIRTALGRWPGAEVLSGPTATKAAILKRLVGASTFYVSAHNVRELDMPVQGFVPVAAADDAPPDASMLEGADVRALDLTACRLAILATCASGTPYRVGIRPGASLSDAFLDAGAGAVVGSFWDVGDSEAQQFMSRFLERWSEGGDDAAALGATVRSLMQAPGGSPPRVWAAWSVQTTSGAASRP